SALPGSRTTNGITSRVTKNCWKSSKTYRTQIPIDNEYLIGHSSSYIHVFCTCIIVSIKALPLINVINGPNIYLKNNFVFLMQNLYFKNAFDFKTHTWYIWFCNFFSYFPT